LRIHGRERAALVLKILLTKDAMNRVNVPKNENATLFTMRISPVEPERPSFTGRWFTL
jgi:hypothetical protein